jgi:cell division protein FtsN
VKPVAFVLLLSCGAGLNGQTADSVRPQDPALQRARQLMTDGKVTEGRRLIDSLMGVTPPENPLYADALYWRAALAPTAAEAERDYRRLLIDVPLSKRAEDAMLQLAQLEQARGDRRGASEHLQRFLLTYSKHPARPRVALTLVRLLFEQGPQYTTRACEAVRRAREEIPSSSLELRNQLEYYAPRCAMAEAAPPIPVAPESASTPTADTVRSAAGTNRTSSGSGRESFYSVQVAAYEAREPAVELSDLLVSRGIDARVDGSVRPFRVRVGRYSTRAEAAKAATTLKSQGYNGFITLVTARGR